MLEKELKPATVKIAHTIKISLTSCMNNRMMVHATCSYGAMMSSTNRLLPTDFIAKDVEQKRQELISEIAQSVSNYYQENTKVTG